MNGNGLSHRSASEDHEMSETFTKYGVMRLGLVSAAIAPSAADMAR
jgi:hypothetical protein